MKRGTLKNIANHCRITPQHLSDILGKRKNPSVRLAVILEEYTSVSRMLWIWGNREELREALEEAYSKSDSEKLNKSHNQPSQAGK